MVEVEEEKRRGGECEGSRVGTGDSFVGQAGQGTWPLVGRVGEDRRSVDRGLREGPAWKPGWTCMQGGQRRQETKDKNVPPCTRLCILQADGTVHLLLAHTGLPTAVPMQSGSGADPSPARPIK